MCYSLLTVSFQLEVLGFCNSLASCLSIVSGDFGLNILCQIPSTTFSPSHSNIDSHISFTVIFIRLTVFMGASRMRVDRILVCAGCFWCRNCRRFGCYRGSDYHGTGSRSNNLASSNQVCLCHRKDNAFCTFSDSNASSLPL